MKQLINSLAKSTGKSYDEIKTELNNELLSDIADNLAKIISDAVELDVDEGSWYVTQDSIETAVDRILEEYILVEF